MLDYPELTEATAPARAYSTDQSVDFASRVLSDINADRLQHTLAGSISCCGVGLHSGQNITLTLRPAASGSGIRFVRTDITDGDNVVPADYRHVSDTRLCTVVSNEAGVQVSTVEHLMAALWACGVDNALIEIDGSEIPVMDGSSAPFVFLIECAGRTAQATERSVLKVLQPVEVTDGDKFVRLTPADEFSVESEIDFDSPVISRQTFTFTGGREHFKHEISRARTFGFAHEVEALRQQGLARGGSLTNAVVVEGDQILNPEGLRYRDEFVRHKVLDCLGDLYLCGFSLECQVTTHKSGHALNNRVLRALFDSPENYRIL